MWHLVHMKVKRSKEERKRIHERYRKMGNEERRIKNKEIRC